ncbi:hypothetical protein HDV06_001291 [Boothiomyces sp. JEL0866]|nr:hypothetical protein HDV06_001291 [Boothiomyces sp. JEL0866]
MLQIYTVDENGEKTIWFTGFQLSGWKLEMYRNIKSSLGFQVYDPNVEENAEQPSAIENDTIIE